MGIKWEIYERAPASVMTPMLLKKKEEKLPNADAK